jgi:hypothetical protein
MEYTVGAIVVVAVLAFVVMPIIRRQPPAAVAAAAAGPVETRAAIYQELLELELDQKVGKITEADYRELSEVLLLRAASLISEEDDHPTAAGDEVEREVAQARASLRQTGTPPAETLNRPC